MSGFGAPARTERPRPASTNGVTVLATTLPFLTSSSIAGGFPVTRSAGPLLILCSSAAPSSWMTITLCPLARSNAAASSLTPGVAPWLVRMTSSAASAAPCGTRAPTNARRDEFRARFHDVLPLCFCRQPDRKSCCRTGDSLSCLASVGQPVQSVGGRPSGRPTILDGEFRRD